MLTAKQSQLLCFLANHQDRHNVTPSFEEMRIGIGLGSKSGIHRLLHGLEERGYIRKLPNRARAVEILRRPNDNKQSDNKRKSLNKASSIGDGQDNISLPLLGRIAAGTPIEALSDETNHISVPPNMLGAGEHFALEIVGDSMIEAGIHEGDTVIIKRTDTANSGDIIVALIDQQEATLKILRHANGQVGLEPANANYETRYFTSDKVRIQGRLTGLLRYY